MADWQNRGFLGAGRLGGIENQEFVKRVSLWGRVVLQMADNQGCRRYLVNQGARERGARREIIFERAHIIAQ